MRKDLIGAASAAALLLSGAAWAQSPSAGGASETERTTTRTESTTQPSTTSPGETTTTSRPGGDSMATSPGMGGSTTAGSAGTMQMDRASAEQMLGKTVVGANGEEIGEVKDVILDPQSGEARQLIIGSGGFLGIGQKNIPVDFADAQVQPGQENITVSTLTREQVREMEGYAYDESTVSLTRQEGGSSGTGTTGQTGAETERTTTTTTTRPSPDAQPPKPSGQ